MFLYILSWFSMIFHVIFMTLALAAALLYLAELVEEYTALAAKIIKGILAVITVIYIGLLILEGFPISMIIAGLFSNGLYFLLLRDFPFIELTSPVFIGGVAYFTICLWILPFAFFVSLSASENVLPTASTASLGEREPNFAYPGQKSSRRHGILALFSFLSKKTEGYLPTRTKTF
ncbi:Protein TEX261 [Acropora cervicornis]|uniref:Protein TEX261 n=1 Tax=Acropora cervicornis TaxID=6130 RepID=A0AAD9VF49_ACRCE|nr:Protein TEX261 [Acropora cervicornis]